MSKYIKILITVTICLTIGYLASSINQSSLETWYPTLIKPSFNPPNWIFAPVWTLLYILMGISAGLIWDKISLDAELVKKGLFFFAIQLAFNSFWSYLFFGLNNLLLASIEIILLLLLIYETYLIFKKLDKKASYMLIPYILWVGFATILTITIYFLNR